VFDYANLIEITKCTTMYVDWNPSVPLPYVN